MYGRTTSTWRISPRAQFAADCRWLRDPGQRGFRLGLRRRAERAGWFPLVARRNAAGVLAIGSQRRRAVYDRERHRFALSGARPFPYPKAGTKNPRCAWAWSRVGWRARLDSDSRRSAAALHVPHGMGGVMAAAWPSASSTASRIWPPFIAADRESGAAKEIFRRSRRRLGVHSRGRAGAGNRGASTG